VARKGSGQTDKLVVLTTVGSEDQAVRIAEELVEGKLAACVNIKAGVRSIYHWKGKLWDDEEFLLLIKTTAAAFEAVRDRIRELHSYELPEILALPVAEGDPGALDWIGRTVESRGRTRSRQNETS
jgi:periplasmic divalent cation tolerance protein